MSSLIREKVNAASASKRRAIPAGVPGRRDRSYQLFENLIPRWRRAAIIWSKMVAAKPKKSSPTWNDVKGKVADFDRAGLVGVLQALYAASKDNRAFLHARLGLGADPIEPFKVTIKRWLWPDVLKDQSTSVSTAKKAIADYKAATGQSEGLAELMVFYCECAAGFSNSVGYEDGVYFDALMRMFEQALKLSVTLPVDQRDVLLDRLDDVRRISHDFGYGLGDGMDVLFTSYGVDD
jgi:hypothetical protein